MTENRLKRWTTERVHSHLQVGRSGCVEEAAGGTSSETFFFGVRQRASKPPRGSGEGSLRPLLFSGGTNKADSGVRVFSQPDGGTEGLTASSLTYTAKPTNTHVLGQGQKETPLWLGADVLADIGVGREGGGGWRGVPVAAPVR